MTTRCVAIALVAMTTSASAELPEVRVLGSVGLRKTWGLGERINPAWPHEAPLHSAAAVTATLVVSPHLSAGVRLAAAYATYPDSYHDCYTLVSIDGAVALQYTDTHFTIGAWLGRNRARLSAVDPDYDCARGSSFPTRWLDDFTSYGVSGTIDVYTRDSHHVAVVLDLQTATGNGALDYSAVTVGVGYRR